MNGPLHGRTLLLGVTGSIAAYKAADLCSQLSKLGAEIHVVLTPAAAQFVGEATFRALTRHPVLTDVFDEPHARRIAHIDLAQSADLVLVAPASANSLAQMAHGLADDLLATCLLATPATTPLLVAPAMNTVMWQHPATVANVETLRQRGVQIIEPGYGLLACQDVGTGKLADVESIVQAICDRLALPASHQEKRNAEKLNEETDSGKAICDWEGQRVLITAGATREPLDPVRFLSNRSSGKMGYALAEAAATRGAQVTLVSGFATVPPPKGVELVRVETAAEMFTACESRFSTCDLLIAAAAVADYTPTTVAPQKIKKPNNEQDEVPLTLTLRRTTDIVATLAARKRPDQIVVGFAAESEELLTNARRKLEKKHLDVIVANDITREGAGFDADTNIVTLLWPDGRVENWPQSTKRAVADRLLDALLEAQRS